MHPHSGKLQFFARPKASRDVRNPFVIILVISKMSMQTTTETLSKEQTDKTDGAKVSNIAYVDFDSEQPILADCPVCKKTDYTLVKTKSGGGAWLASALICLVGLWCGCWLIPFHMHQFKAHSHKCQHCGASLGRGHGSLTW